MFNSIVLNKERKIILIGGAVLLLFGAIYRFSPAIVPLFSVKDEIVLKTKYVEKYLRVAEQKKQAVDENVYVKRQFKQMQDRLLTGKTPSLSSVEIQNILNGIAESENLKFMTMRVNKPQEAENKEYVTLPVEFSMNSDIRQLKEIIYQIEASQKLLVITELIAHMIKSKNGPTMIRSAITVEGVMKAPPAE